MKLTAVVVEPVITHRNVSQSMSLFHPIIKSEDPCIQATGSKAFSIQQFVNDTVGLTDVLKIQKADVLGHSMGGMIAQQLAVTHPEKVNTPPSSDKKMFDMSSSDMALSECPTSETSPG